jgi:imidazolonepropionase-like amidohydrolase
MQTATTVLGAASDRRCRAALGCAALLASALLATPAAAADTQIIDAGWVVHPESGEIERNQRILVEGGLIKAVGSNVDAPAGAVSIDLSSSWVFPGLMDAHTHLTTGAAAVGNFDLHAEYLTKSSGYRALVGLRKAQDVLQAGFTTVKDIGNEAEYAATDLRRAIERGFFDGPTMLTAGKIIAPYGGQSHGMTPEVGRFWQHEYIDADGPDEIRRAVRQNLYYGANTIKLVADNSRFFYTQEEIEAAVDEAHRAGVTLSVHVMGGEPARNVILGGADSIEHGFGLSDELLELMKEHGTVLVGTDFPIEHLRAMGTAGGILDQAEQTSNAILDRLRRAHRLGVKMAFGTDVVVDIAGRSRADMMLDYLDVWVEAGIPPAAILKAMTSDCAELFGLAEERGRVAPEQAADLVAAPTNPLDDIHALKQIDWVMKGGKVVRQQ